MKKRENKIRAALKRGRLVIAPRASGKTMAIAKILMKDPETIVVSHNESSYLALTSYLIDLGMLPSKVPDRVFIASQRLNEFGFTSRMRDKKIIVDEYFLSSYRGPFYAATSSTPRRTTIIK